MALNDVKIVSGGGLVFQPKVEDRTTSSDTQIVPGDVVKKGGTGTNFVTHVATGEPTNAAPMYGVAISYSTETATEDGEVWVQQIVPGQTILEAKATTSANLSDGILNDAVTFDLTSTTYTVDEDEGDDPDVHGLIILSYDSVKGTVRFLVKAFANEQTSNV